MEQQAELLSLASVGKIFRTVEAYAVSIIIFLVFFLVPELKVKIKNHFQRNALLADVTLSRWYTRFNGET